MIQWDCMKCNTYDNIDEAISSSSGSLNRLIPALYDIGRAFDVLYGLF